LKLADETKAARAAAHRALGHLYREQGNAATARVCYLQALEFLRQSDFPPWNNESLAGLAAAEMAQGELDQAQVHVAEILAFLDGGGWLLGDCKPFWIYLVCTQVLAAAGDPRAGEILARAHTELQEWAAHCPDEATRRSFLENVPWHRELAREWQLAHPGEAGNG
jgi:tetratricopeptide (TPR) repeat protein